MKPNMCNTNSIIYCNQFSMNIMEDNKLVFITGDQKRIEVDNQFIKLSLLI